MTPPARKAWRQPEADKIAAAELASELEKIRGRVARLGRDDAERKRLEGAVCHWINKMRSKAGDPAELRTIRETGRGW